MIGNCGKLRIRHGRNHFRNQVPLTAGTQQFDQQTQMAQTESPVPGSVVPDDAPPTARTIESISCVSRPTEATTSHSTGKPEIGTSSDLAKQASTSRSDGGSCGVQFPITDATPVTSTLPC